jgi:DNA-binding SARP family transcriptional activator
MDLFWPDLDHEAAGANLRKAVHFARRSIGDHALLDAAGDVFAFAPGSELRVAALWEARRRAAPGAG